MTRAQYIEIADNHGRFKDCDLNIRMATVTAMAKRGWIGVDTDRRTAYA